MDQAKRTLNMIVASFAGAGIIAVLALSVVDFGDPAEPDLAQGAALAATVFGAIGLLVALVWWQRIGERRMEPNRLMIGVVVRVAIAELGLLLGILGLVMTGSATAPYVGLGFFLLALAAMYAGLRRIE